MKSKKGQTEVLTGLTVTVVGLLILGVLLGVTQLVLQDFSDKDCPNGLNSTGQCPVGDETYLFNVSHQGQLGLDQVSDDQGLLATVLVASALIAIVIGAFRFFA